MGLACYVLWGLFPFYFHALRSAGAVELLAWRIVFSLALSVVLVPLQFIAMAMTAFILTLAYRQYRYRTADVIEDDLEDAAIAARPTTASAAPDHDASDDPSTGRMTSEGDSFGPRSFEAPVKADEDD